MLFLFILLLKQFHAMFGLMLPVFNRPYPLPSVEVMRTEREQDLKDEPAEYTGEMGSGCTDFSGEIQLHKKAPL